MVEVVVILQAILGGVGAGAIAAFLGWAKARKWEKFDGPAFLKTLILGAILGGLAGGLGISSAQAEVFLQEIGLMAGVIYVVENIAKTIWRRLGFGAGGEGG